MRSFDLRRWRVVALTVVLSGVACGSPREPTRSTAASPSPASDVVVTTAEATASTVATSASDPDDAAASAIGVVDVVVPTAPADDHTLIVLVPGGGWINADPSGLVPLAHALADAGHVAVTTTYRASSDDAHFPVPAADVACAIASAGEMSRAAGFPPREVIVVGHSAGAHLAALVALQPEEFSADCTSPPLPPDRLIGLAGPYDVASASGAAIELFGPDDPDPTNWDRGNPLAHVDQRPELEVLLAHGTADDVVPVGFTEAFADALRTAGHDVEEVYIDDADHHSIYSADTATPVVLEWLTL